MVQPPMQGDTTLARYVSIAYVSISISVSVSEVSRTWVNV
jgi:hypothetical protein